MITEDEIFNELVPNHRPARATPGSVGWDCRIVRTTLMAQTVRRCGLGFSLNLPPRWHAKLYLRSSLAYYMHLVFANGVGIIDADYRDEVCALLYNLSPELVDLTAGERIAQLIIITDTGAPYWGTGDTLHTSRTGGFGSTGT